MTTSLKTEQLRALIKDLVGNGSIFSVDFVKKNGEFRTMKARLGVKKHLKGGELPFDPVDKGLLPVFDMEKQAYRMINLKTVTEIRAKGNVYRFSKED